jgi:hypothetical protein
MESLSNEFSIETLLENLPPRISPRLERRLSSAPWTSRTIKQKRVLNVVYLVIFLFIAFISLTSQGRAFAQAILNFFTTTDQQSISLSKEEVDLFYTPAPTYALSLVEVTSSPPLTGRCSNIEGTGTYECKIQYVENQLNIDIKEFSVVPPGWAFKEIDFHSTISSTNNVVVISYQTPGAYLFLRQGSGEFPPDTDWGKVFISAIQKVKIGQYDGEYVNGTFALKNGDDQITWESTGSDQRIRWREDKRWFEIVALVGPGTSGYLNQEALISLASDMVYQPENFDQTTKVDFIPNIALAEKICRCTILQPTTLPDGMSFDYARYDPYWKSITLNYGYRALRIVQTPMESVLIKDLDSYKNLESVQIGDTVGQYGISPAQKTIWESSTAPVFPTNNSYSVLLWKKDGMVYQIYFDQSFSDGGQLTKDQMIEIAESLR